MNTISVVMHALNEEEFIGESLRSVVPFVDQAVVIDQGSTDGTLAILREIPNVTVFQAQGNFLTRGEKYFRDLAVELCRSDWLMPLDADEVLSPGWPEIVRPFLQKDGQKCGLLLIDYWQMVGSTGFHTPDSPLPNERPFLFRKHPQLTSSESANQTKCHCSYCASVSPQTVAQIPSAAACLHLGYTKSDLITRFERNIERGDWEKSEIGKLGLLRRAVEDPLQFLPRCIPRTISDALIPESIRTPKWDCAYNSETKRILSRSPATQRA